MNKKRVGTMALAVLLFFGCPGLSHPGKAFARENETEGQEPQEMEEQISQDIKPEEQILQAQGMEPTAKAPEGYTLAAENDFIILYANEEAGAIHVVDKETGYVWSSAVDPAKYTPEGEEPDAYFLETYSSLFGLSYTDLGMNTTDIITAPVNTLEPEIGAEKIKNGIRFSYHLPEENISLAVEISIDGKSLIVSVPSKRIREGEGTKKKLDGYVRTIREFIAHTEEIVEEAEKLKLSENKTTIANARKDIAKLREYFKDVESAVGIQYISDNARKVIQGSLNTYIYGGKKAEKGFFNKIRESDEVSGKEKDRFAKLRNDLEEEEDYAVYCVGLMKSIQYGGMIQIQLLPNFGASSDDEKGYTFFPNGSGAIAYNKPDHGNVTGHYEQDVYSDRDVDVRWEFNRDLAGLKRAMLPVYGSKKENDAFLAMIEKGAEEASVSFYPSGNTINLNRINANFTYRNMVEITSSSDYASGTAKVYEKERNSFDAAVRFQFLNGKQANYSGMANAYRTYLQERSLLNKSDRLKKGKIPMGLEFVGGVEKPVLFFNRFIPFSTFGQVQDIMGKLKTAGVENMMIGMDSWTDPISRPTRFRPAAGLGGEQGLKDLEETVRREKDALFLAEDYVYADSSDRRINKKKLANDTNQRIFEFGTHSDKLFSPLVVKESLLKQSLPAHKKYGNPGMMVSAIPNLMYYDYNEKYRSTRAGTVKTWMESYEQAARQIELASMGGNLYVLKNSSWLLDIPIGSTDYVFADRSVPFYQMVVHGSIPYTAKPFNTFFDKELEKLKAIEYGCAPFYLLTVEETARYADIYNEFTTPYPLAEEEIIDTYREFDENFSRFTDAYMISHEYRSDDVAVVKYSNNRTIYINYSGKEVKADDVVVPAKGYVVH